MEVESLSDFEEEITLPQDVPNPLRSEKPTNPDHQLDGRKIMINVSGQQFVTTFNTLLKYPETKLGQLASQQANVTNYFFESDPDIFKEVLKFYRNNELHCPKNVCFSDFREHLNFWEIDIAHISDCCSHAMKEEMQLEKQFRYFDRRVELNSNKLGCCKRFSYYLWMFLADPDGPNTKWKMGAKIWMVFYLLVMFLSAASIAVGSLSFVYQYEVGNSTTNDTSGLTTPAMRTRAKSCIEYISWRRAPALLQLSLINVFLAVFYISEIWIRFLCCPNKSLFWRSIHGMDMVISHAECLSYGYFLYLMIDFFPNRDSYQDADSYCIVADYLEVTILIVQQMRFLRLLSYASVYSGLKVLLITLYRSWREILLLIILLVIAVLVFGPLVYVLTAGFNREPDKISNIPEAYWFVIVTMTTVGYGDMYPTTVTGYFATVIVMIAGLTITALPIAIVGGNFTVVYEYNQKFEKQRKEAVANTKQAAEDTE